MNIKAKIAQRLLRWHTWDNTNRYEASNYKRRKRFDKLVADIIELVNSQRENPAAKTVSFNGYE